MALLDNHGHLVGIPPQAVETIAAARGYIHYHEIPGVSHASDDCYDKFISDGLFEKELGI